MFDGLDGRLEDEYDPIPRVLGCMAGRGVCKRGMRLQERVLCQRFERRLAVVDVDAYQLRRCEARYRALGMTCGVVDDKVSAADRVSLDCQMLVQVIHGHDCRLEPIG